MIPSTDKDDVDLLFYEVYEADDHFPLWIIFFSRFRLNFRCFKPTKCTTEKKQTCYLPTGLNVTAGETRQVTTSDDVRSVGWQQGVCIMNLCISSVVQTCGPWLVGISDAWIACVLTLLSLTLSSFP